MADNQIDVQIRATTDDLQRGMTEAAEAVQQLPTALTQAAGAASGFGDSLKKAGEIAAGVFGGLELEAGVSKIKDALKEAVFGTAEWAESLQYLDLVLGVTSTQMQELQGAANIAGVSADRIQSVMQHVDQQLAAAASGAGSKAFKAAMADLGVKPADAASTFDFLTKVSAGLDQIGAGSLRAREDFVAVFGRASLALEPLMSNLAETTRLSREMGVETSAEVAKAGEFQRAINTLAQAFTVLKHETGVALAGVGEEIAKLFIASLDYGKAVVSTIYVSIAGTLEAIGEYASSVGTIVKDALTGQWAAIPGVFHAANALIIKDFHDMGSAIVGDWTEASTRVAAAMKLIAMPEVTPTGGPGLPSDNSAALKKAALDKYETLRAELALELAETGKNIDAKMALEQAFVEKVRAIHGLPLKDLISAFAEEQRAWETYLGAKLKAQLDEATNSQTVAKGALAFQQAQDAQGLAAATAAARIRLAVGVESKQQELADLISIGSQEIAAEQTVENQRFANAKSELLSKLTALRQSGLDEREEINKTNAAILALEQAHQAAMLNIATKGETEKGKQVAQIAAANLKDQATLFNSILEPIASGFDSMFDGVIRGTQTVSDAFRKMAQDLLLSIAKSGIKDLLLGGSSGSIGASIFGDTGKGGGIAGMIASAFGGPAITGTLTKALTAAFSAAQSFIAGIFKGALSGISSSAGVGVAGAAVSAAAGSAGQATAFKEALGPLQLLMQGHLAEALVQTGMMAAHLAVATAHAATAMAHYLVSMVHTMWLALIAFIDSAGAPKPFGFAHGGIVPSARAGMLAGGGTLAVLHPNEMVLPSKYSDVIQGMAAGGSGSSSRSSSSDSAQQGGGHTITVNYSVNAVDARSFQSLIHQHAEVIGDAVYDRMTRYGGRFEKRVG